MTGDVTHRERELLGANRWSISGIVLWEIWKLAELGRIGIDLADPELPRVLRSIHSRPISVEVCQRLGELDFRSDPADEMIAATSLAHGAPLLTRDRKLRRARRVPLA